MSRAGDGGRTVSRVRRDAHGIPHLTAGSLPALARLQGRVTAQDRAWQLEHARRKATGRLAEVLGARALAWDCLARRVGLEALGRRVLAGLDVETRDLLTAYAEGVDEGLAGLGPDEQPPELVALGIAPEPWEPWVPPAVFAAHHLLFASFPTKLWRRHLDERLGRPLALLFHDEGLWASGSNSWVLGGARTASGRPLLAGDPHRSFEAPNAYQQVRLTCTDPDDPFDVRGFTFPGVPGVQHFAHAGPVAWGITNAMADYQDLYLERLTEADGRVWAEGPQGPEPVEQGTATVRVRDGDPVDLTLLRTGRGPVVHGGPGSPAPAVGGDLAISLRTPSLVLGDLGFGCLLPLLRARSAADVEAALDGWVEPVNNLLVADADGAVRQRVVGRVPARAEENRWRPVPAWLPEHAWDGWLADLPHQEVPPQGQLVTANHRMSAGFDRIGVEFAPPARADRIEALLAGRSGLTVEDMAAVHRDDLAGQPMALRRALADLDPGALSEAARTLRADLLAWDGHWGADSVLASAYAGVRDALVASLAASDRFAPLADHGYGPLLDPWFVPPVQLYLSLATLLAPRGRSLVPEVEELLRTSVERVAARRGDLVPWGRRHRFRPFHAAAHLLDAALLGLAEEPPLAGDNDCVRCTGTVPGGATAVRGSVARYVWDLADPDGGGWVVPLGASGDPRSPHHHDQCDAWVEGRLLPFG